MPVFISYRRGPLSDVMGRRLQQWLQQELRASTYRDVASIEIGVKFREHLERALSSCSVGLVLIDPDWAVPRLQQADDWVRMEIEYMLGRRIPIASVLLGGACRPSPEELPDSLKPLLDQPVYPLNAGDEFDRDIVPIGSFVSRQLPAYKTSPLSIMLAVIGWALLSTGGAIAAYRVHERVAGVASGAGSGQSSSNPAPASNDSQPTIVGKEPAASAPPPAVNASSTPTSVSRAAPQITSPTSGGKPASLPAGATGVDPICSEVCPVEGRCTLVDGMLGQGCVATSEADCRKSSECAGSGLCSLSDRVCSARSDADCSGSKGCSANGQCRAKEGRCEALSDADCASASDCLGDGKCSRHATGICGYATDADCAKSRKCKERGACTHQKFSCLVTKDSDCANSTDCKTTGRCKLGNRDCRPGSAKDCQQSTGCKEQGKCVIDEFGIGCKRPPPPSDAEPAKSK